MRRHDFKGSGKSQLLVTSPWGLGTVGWEGGKLTSVTMWRNGTGTGWQLDTAHNRAQLIGDIDGDGKSEVLLSGPDGIAFLGLSGIPAIKVGAKNGKRVGDWIVNTQDNQFWSMDDFDGDGKDEVLVSSPWGVGILKVLPTGLPPIFGGIAHTAQLTSATLAANGTRLGSWLLNTQDNWFPATGDLDGDGRSEIVVQSNWGLGVLGLRGSGLTSLCMVAQGTQIGSWTYDAAQDRVEAVGDFDGDGKDELLIAGPRGITILKLAGDRFTCLAHVANGSRAGQWMVDADHNAMGRVGNLSGGRRSEIVITSDWGLGVLRLELGRLSSRLMLRNGSKLGQWVLNTRDNRFGQCLDLDGDGRDELVVTSPWGLGVLRLGPNPDAFAMAANGSALGSWRVNTEDNDWESGSTRSWCLMVHHKDWGGAISSTREAMLQRGYVMLETNEAAKGRKLIEWLSRQARQGDRVFIYLAGHGATTRKLNDYSVAAADTHTIQFGDNNHFRLGEVRPAFELAANRGAEVSIFDGSCDAGETVLAAIGQRYLALSTCAMHSPGLTNTPSPGSHLAAYGQPNPYGMWWSRGDVVSRMTGAAPHRFYQKIFRNDDTHVARWSLFYKSAIMVYPGLARPWNLVTRYCYLFEHIFADQFNAAKPSPEVVSYRGRNKISLEDYLASMQADRDDNEPALQQVDAILADADLAQRAARVYAAAFPRPWQTTTGLFDWNPSSTPTKTVVGDCVLQPGRWAGTEGFIRLVAECRRLVSLLKASWYRQKTSLIQLDSILRPPLLTPVQDLTAIRLVPDAATQLRRSEFEERERVEHLRLIEDLRSGSSLRLPILKKPRPTPIRLPGSDGQEPSTPAKLDIPNLTAAAQKTQATPRPVSSVPDIRLHLQSDVLDIDALRWSIRKRLLDAIYSWVSDKSAAEIIAEIRASYTTDELTLKQLHYYLTIVEEAMSKAQEEHAQAGDLVSF